MFSGDEHARYIDMIHSLYREALVMASNYGPGDARCGNKICDTGAHRGYVAPHGSEQFYEEIAEAWIGRIFLSAHRPDQLKEQFISFLKSYDHVVEARLTDVPLGETVELFIKREARERDQARLV
jgi:hypothetical protein